MFFQFNAINADIFSNSIFNTFIATFFRLNTVNVFSVLVERR